jgi:hypothetical protein
MGSNSMSSMGNNFVAFRHHHTDTTECKKCHHPHYVEPMNAQQQEEIKNHEGIDKVNVIRGGIAEQKPRIQTSHENKKKMGNSA